jgi:hypothetical protein
MYSKYRVPCIAIRCSNFRWCIRQIKFWRRHHFLTIFIFVTNRGNKLLLTCRQSYLPRFPNYSKHIHTMEDCSYVHHSLVAHWNKLPSCECELLVGCRDDEGQTPLKRDRSSHPVAPPHDVSHLFSLGQI